MITEQLRQYVSTLLREHSIECVIGYEAGPRGIARPVFISQAEDVFRLVWNQECSHNLTTYLHHKLKDVQGKVGVVVKPCDSKTIRVLAAENRIDRSRVLVIGVLCAGVAEKIKPGNLAACQIQDRCLTCELIEPVETDYLIGEQLEKNLGDDRAINNLSSWLEVASSDERLEFWVSEFDRCIRCYACRQACPLCDCPTCLFEREDSTWTGIGATIKDNRTFHLGRAFHLAGRCIGCGECEQVCPMDIKLGQLNQILAREIETRFQYHAGISMDPNPITTILGGR